LFFTDLYDKINFAVAECMGNPQALACDQPELIGRAASFGL
jgi:hypothetical protein